MFYPKALCSFYTFIKIDEWSEQFDAENSSRFFKENFKLLKLH